MKNTIILIFLLSAVRLFAQINVGSTEKLHFRPGDFQDSDIQMLRSSKTIFVYRQQDITNLEVFKTALKSVWTLTKLEFVSYEEFKKNKYSSNISFFTLGRLSRTSSISVPAWTHVYLSLWMNSEEGKKTFCRIEMDPSFDTADSLFLALWKDDDLGIKHLYEKTNLPSWNALYLKNALQTVCNHIERGQLRWLFSSKASKLQMLKKDTLYVAEYSANRPFFRPYKKGKEAFSSYPFPYKIVPNDELTRIGLNSKSGIYYFTFLRSEYDKFITITNSLTGEIVYSNYESMSLFLQQKDIKKIVKYVKKGK